MPLKSLFIAIFWMSLLKVDVGSKRSLLFVTITKLFPACRFIHAYSFLIIFGNKNKASFNRSAGRKKCNFRLRKFRVHCDENSDRKSSPKNTKGMLWTPPPWHPPHPQGRGGHGAISEKERRGVVGVLWRHGRTPVLIFVEVVREMKWIEIEGHRM